MKTLKTILASCLALTLVSAASAQTILRITGSTAYRAAVYKAIGDILQPGFVFGYTGSSASGASQAIYTGTATNGTSVIIKTSFSGSVGGISTLAADLTIGPGGTFTGGGGFLVNSTPQSTGGTANVPATFESPVTADVAMADCFQVSAPAIYQSPVLTDKKVGVVPFVFLLTAGKAAAGSNPTNITKTQAKNILVNASVRLSALTGNSADTEHVFGVGRDEDSGTRIQALACSAVGIETDLMQYQPLFDGNTTPTNPPPAPGSQITGAALWPALTLNAISYPQGDSGYSGGGSLAAAVKVSHAGSFPTYNNWFLSYFGINDAATVTDGIQLDFGGVAYSAANVEGPGATGFVAQYTFWGYEHFFTRSGFSGPGSKVAALISGDLTKTAASVSGILLSQMNVKRTKDGGPISPK